LTLHNSYPDPVEGFCRRSFFYLEDFSFTVELRNKRYETDDSVVIKRYLEEFKQGATYFTNILKGGIQ